MNRFLHCDRDEVGSSDREPNHEETVRFQSRILIGSPAKKLPEEAGFRHCLAGAVGCEPTVVTCPSIP